MISWHEWAASYVSDSDMAKKHPQKYITLDELLKEVMPLLSHYAPNTIEEIPVFTDLVAKPLRSYMTSPNSICWISSMKELHEAA